MKRWAMRLFLLMAARFARRRLIRLARRQVLGRLKREGRELARALRRGALRRATATSIALLDASPVGRTRAGRRVEAWLRARTGAGSGDPRRAGGQHA